MVPAKSSLVLKNGVIYTVNNKQPWADTMIIVGDRIAFIGNFAEIEGSISAEQIVIDLEGKMVLPGFIDAHSHPSHG
ncbi:MAG: amidohydrolase family protein, partial [Anaerolineales bacterium]